MRIKRISCKMLLQEIYKRAIETVLKNKKEEIKNRIDLINRGEVPEGYKCCWGYIYPESWNIKSLKDLFYKVKTKNAANESLPVLTNSATLGVILQDEYFDREIVNDENTNNYYIVENGDFMYNPRISSNAPAGPINRNTLGQKGIASPLYTIFRAKDTKNIEFVEKYFKSNYWHRYMKSVSNQGARHDRLNINDEDFMRMPIPQPSKQEQEKIAKILNGCDKVIELKEKLLEEKIKQNFNFKKQILEDKNSNWEQKKIFELSKYETANLTIREALQQEDGNCKIYDANSVIKKSKQYQFKDKYISIVKDGAGVGRLNLCEAKSSILATMGAIFANENIILLEFLYYSLQLFDFGKLVSGTTIPHIYYKDYSKLYIKYPANLETQKSIIKVLKQEDRKIELITQELEQYKQLKKALSQLLLTGIVRTVEVDCEN